MTERRKHMGFIKKVFSGFISIFAVTSPLFADQTIYDSSLEELMNLTVTTASKKEQKLSQATSIMTVITRREIENSGMITLYDLMKRIPGFFPSHQSTWGVLTARGLPADSTDHFLLLVDGHPQNSIIGQGYQQQDRIPILDQVERIEIIRGPGSILWGSNAVMGIINVITLESFEGTKVTSEFQTTTHLDYANLLGGLGDGKDVKGMYSLTVWQASGYSYNKDGVTTIAPPWGSIQTSPSSFGPWPEIDKQREGFELYGKVKFKDDTEFYARLLKTSFNYPWDEWSVPPRNALHELGNRRAYVGLKKRYKVSDSFHLEANLYADYNFQNRDPLDLFNPTDAHSAQDQTNEEFATGIEELNTFNLSETNMLKIGVKYVRTVSGPNRDTRLDPTNNTPISVGSGTTSNGSPFSYNVPYFGITPGIDNNFALYSEDSQTFGSATLFAGGRFDWDDYREMGGKILPRAGIIYNFDDHFVGKYVFNTGYMRPVAVFSKTMGVIVDSARGGAFPILRVTNSENVQSHEIQVSYTGPKSYGALTLFYEMVNNYITFDSTHTPQGYKNIGDAQTRGAELEGKHSLNDFTYIYGNLSYAVGSLSDATFRGALTDDSGVTLNYPQLMANLGTDMTFRENHTLNVNLRAWSNMRYILGQDENPSGPSTYGTLGPEFYLDVNYSVKRFFSIPIDFNVFVTNVTDNQNKVGLVVNNGTYRPEGRAAGIRISYSF